MYCFLKDLFIKWYHFRISAKVAMKQLILIVSFFHLG